MSEKCPLRDGLPYTDTEDGEFRIPDICMQQCEQVWDKALDSDSSVVDNLDLNHGSDEDRNGGTPCRHYVEYGGEVLRRIGDKQSVRRGYGVISVCGITGEEAFATDVDFECPYN